jgi:hypothetical protein
MPTDRIPQELFGYHPKGRRERGRPLKRWGNQFNYPWDCSGSKRPVLVDGVDIISEICIVVLCS